MRGRAAIVPPHPARQSSTSRAGADIDFGHFLGNFKTWKSVKREREAFVFTKAMAHVVRSGAGAGADRC